MKIIYAARFLGIALLAAGLISMFFLKTGISTLSTPANRQIWLVENTLFWRIGWWLWLVTIFAWMVLIVALMWSYLPSYRVPTMLQTGLMIIGAGLAVAGVVIWMNVLPTAALGNTFPADVGLVDSLAMGLVGAGLFMGGCTTAWITVDLLRGNAMPSAWLYPGLACGFCIIPAPFLLPRVWLLLLAGLCWLIWCSILGTRKEMPNAFTEWL